MTKIKTFETIQTDHNEINILVDALHLYYMTNKTSENMTKQKQAADAKQLRNELSNLINRSFMGVDA